MRPIFQESSQKAERGALCFLHFSVSFLPIFPIY
jgi:hypothetical protein